MLNAPFQNRPASLPVSRRSFLRLAGVSAILVTMWLLTVASASAETRTLRMYFTHTKESATITFKKNGRYINSGLRKANRFLRDWRRKEPTRMDPELLDLVWEVYKRSGSRKPVHVISGYRSPRTNNMLRRRGRKVAKTSQHMRGKALDFFMPDVSVKKLRALGLKAHRGGVGYYRGSFVHLDTGRVRHWPRMSRRQLARVFPRGKTIHVPSNGRPLKGYKVAMANLKRGRNANGSKRGTTIRGGTSILASLFQGNNRGRGGDEEEDKIVAPKPKKKPELKKKPEPVAVAKAEVPKLRRKRGADPFASEAEAVEDTAEEAKPELVAMLASSRLAVPVRRPGAAVPEKPAIEATELALASPPATAEILRPSAEIPAPSASPSAILASAQVPQQTAGLKERVATALTRQRSSTVAQRAAEALVVRRPQVSIQTALLETPKQPSSSNQLEARLGPKASALGSTQPSKPLETPATATLPTEVEVPLPAAAEPAKLDEAVVLAALKRREGLNREQLPVLSNNTTETSASVPIPRPIESTGTEIAKVETPAPAEPEMQSELVLGNLDGYSVKVWAVAASTRIGPIAKLQAPAYKKSLERQAPVTVIGDGFTSKRPPIRSDRFTGRSLTTVAFAKLASL